MTSPAELHTQFARVTRSAFDHIDAHPNWPAAAADALIHLPAIRAAFTALDRLNAELQRHAGESWGEGSETTTCATCRTSFPCATYSTLTGDSK